MRSALRFAGQAGEDAQLSDHQEFQVYRFIVANEAGTVTGIGAISTDQEDDFGFVVLAGGIFDANEAVLGIVVKNQLVGTAGATDAKVAERSFLTGESLLVGYGVPLEAHGGDLLQNTFPEGGRKGDGGFATVLFFRGEAVFGELSGEEFLCRLFDGIVSHAKDSPRKILQAAPRVVKRQVAGRYRLLHGRKKSAEEG